jgi:hypothetical protein
VVWRVPTQWQQDVINYSSLLLAYTINTNVTIETIDVVYNLLTIGNTQSMNLCYNIHVEITLVDQLQILVSAFT